jgi:hypothetical protein
LFLSSSFIFKEEEVVVVIVSLLFLTLPTFIFCIYTLDDLPHAGTY